ncbi:MAG: VOC family protein [Bacillota bacterium]
MRIEHIALWTSDLERMKEFYMKFFSGKSGDKYHNRNTGFESYFITFDTGARLEIMTKPSVMEDDKDCIRRGYAHLAFSVGSREEVDGLTNILRDSGYMVLSEPRITGDGYYESCIADPDGNTIEISV